LNHVVTIKAVTIETAAPLPKPAGPLTLDQIKMVAQAMKRIRLRGETEEVRAVGEGASLTFWRMQDEASEPLTTLQGPATLLFSNSTPNKEPQTWPKKSTDPKQSATISS
jgi:hypothetical protein